MCSFVLWRQDPRPFHAIAFVVISALVFVVGSVAIYEIVGKGHIIQVKERLLIVPIVQAIAITVMLLAATTVLRDRATQ